MTTKSGVIYKKCHFCGKLQPNIKKCSGCSFALYCNKECQRSDWNSHKNICQRVSNGNLKIVTNNMKKLNIKTENGGGGNKDDKVYIPAKDARELFEELEEERENDDEDMIEN